MKATFSPIVVALCAWLPTTISSQAATIYSLAEDASVTSTGVISRLNNTAVTVGFEEGFAKSGVLVFQLPTLAAGETLANAVLSLRVAVSGSPNFTFDLYGLGFRTSPTVLASDYFSGSLDTTDATMIADNFFTPSSATGNKTFNGAALTSYLNEQILAGASGNYIFIRASADVEPVSGSAFYYVGSYTNVTLVPSLTFDVVPEPASAMLVGFGAMAVALRRRRAN
jgi:hypothetical protein